MPEVWGHVATGFAAVTGMGIMQRIIIGMQNRNVDKAVNIMVKTLEAKQDKLACGLISSNIGVKFDRLDGDVKEIKNDIKELYGVTKNVENALSRLNGIRNEHDRITGNKE